MTTPTQATEIAGRLREIAATLLASTSEDWVALRAADMLTAFAAAAEVGEKEITSVDVAIAVEAATIERCAGELDRLMMRAAAAAIRALKG